MTENRDDPAHWITLFELAYRALIELQARQQWAEAQAKSRFCRALLVDFEEACARMHGKAKL